LYGGWRADVTSALLPQRQPSDWRGTLVKRQLYGDKCLPAEVGDGSIAGPYERLLIGTQNHAIGPPDCGHWWPSLYAAFLYQDFPPPMTAM
jgi:hypothetical protein